jgi:hypothetical protein
LGPGRGLLASASALLIHVTATLLTRLLPATLLATLPRLLFLLARLLSATTLLAALVLSTLVLMLIHFATPNGMIPTEAIREDSPSFPASPARGVGEPKIWIVTDIRVAARAAHSSN